MNGEDLREADGAESDFLTGLIASGYLPQADVVGPLADDDNDDDDDDDDDGDDGAGCGSRRTGS